jgi:hypothetical protein
VREIRKATGWTPPLTWKDKLKDFMGIDRPKAAIPKPLPPKVVIPPSSLLQDMLSIYRNRSEFADMEIHVMDNKIPANKIICCARSKYLRELIMEVSLIAKRL